MGSLENLCVYCLNTTTHENRAPHWKDGREWGRFAKQHKPDCPWIATRNEGACPGGPSESPYARHERVGAVRAVVEFLRWAA